MHTIAVLVRAPFSEPPARWRAYSSVLAEFAARRPQDPAGSWYTPDQTVGFWIRRMAQEKVIHSMDAELGIGQPVAPVPADLAVDGIDELLRVLWPTASPSGAIT